MTLLIKQIINGYIIQEIPDNFVVTVIKETYFKSNKKVKAVVGELLGVPKMTWLGKKKTEPVASPEEAPQV